jgi:multiple sugar transport system ATP-binding protein
MAEVKLVNIAKAYDRGPRVIRDVSIKVVDKEFLVFVGPSGCGKSTLLRMIAGLEEVTDGQIYIGEKLVNDVPSKDRDIAMVFQNYALYPHMTVYENMAFGLKLRSFAKADIRERVTQAARILEIENLLHRKPKDMSGGQRQRVAIGRALVRHPKVFLFDEPLSNLDAKLRVQMRIELQNLHRDLRATMIYVTHDQTEAMTLGDRIVVLKDGDVMQQDTPINLYNHPVNQFVAGFIGTPPMNFIPGRITDPNGVSFVSANQEVIIPLSATSHGLALAPFVGKEVTLGIRAEHLSGQKEPGRSYYSHMASIFAVEHMGNELLAYFLVEGQKIVARLNADFALSYNQSVPLYWNVEKCHFFDTLTSLRIRANN